jgi:xanthine/CO dehydrogenase XdhC/CoxF family maturation factor
MSDLEHILPLWRELEAASAEYVLATVVKVEGSSYRKPGACMLVAADGRRAGTVSGGCLEAEVAQRAFWLTANGPVVQRYSNVEEDGDLPYGSGCGGVVYLLLERRSTAGSLLLELDNAFKKRHPMAVATILTGPQLGLRAFSVPVPEKDDNRQDAIDTVPTAESPLHDFAEIALDTRASIETMGSIQDLEVHVWANYRPARPGLWIFGAGDDAQPLHRQARELGWFVSVADGRSQLSSHERFPLADQVCVLPMTQPLGDQPLGPLTIFNALHPSDAAVVMTHSFEQDARILSSLLSCDMPLAYIGILGPQRRTRELLVHAAQILKISASETGAQIEHWLSQLHAPMGLDLGAESPATIALSVIAEIQKSLTEATALPLRQVRTAPMKTPR